MASTLLNAIFNAEEDISPALNEILTSTRGLQSGISRLEGEMRDLTNLTNISESELNDLRNSLVSMQGAAKTGEQGMQEMSRAMYDLQRGAISADEATDQINTAMAKLSASSQITEQSLDSMRNEVNRLAAEGTISEGWAERFTEALADLGKGSLTTKQAVETLRRSVSEAGNEAMGASFEFGNYGAALKALDSAALSSVVPQKALAQAANRTEDALEETGDAASGTAAQLTTLNAIAGTSALTFGSLSVNIGPFNLALRNILTQLPAILAGMSTLLALVSALAGAFLVLGGVLGAIVAGGALAFFEDFSEQFEDSAQAVEALMGALQDLFTDAMEPLMTDANMDLFIDTINAAAEIVHQFAQFAAQMRDDVLALVDDIDADMEGMFESMHDTFVLMMPALEGFIEFIINDLPDIMVVFAQLADSMGDDIMRILTAVGTLIMVLLDFVETILPTLAGAIQIILGVLSALFGVFNALPDFVTTTILVFALLTFTTWKLISSLAALGVWLGNISAAMTGHAARGSFLGSVYTRLTGIMASYNAGLISTTDALKLAASALWNETAAVLGSAKAKVWDNTITRTLRNAYSNLVAAIKSSTLWKYAEQAATWALTTAKTALSGAILGLIGFLFGEAAATSVAAGAMSVYATVASIAAAATSILAAAAAALSLPIVVVAGAVIALIGALLWLVQILTGIDIFGPLIDGAMAVVGWLMDIIGLLGSIVGLGGGDVGPGDSSVVNTDDIQTNPNVDLDFEENLEQNMDVQADPEDREGLRRIVKDAMNEANSLQRRRQGH